MSKLKAKTLRRWLRAYQVLIYKASTGLVLSSVYKSDGFWEIDGSSRKFVSRRYAVKAALAWASMKSK